MMEKIYIVKYSEGYYSDYREHNLFATTKKSIATKYITRFNNLLKQLEKRNKIFESENYGNWISDEYSDKFYRSWYKVRETNPAFWQEIKLKN
jgi:hypothetical protein